jgi:diketogulonate reductase-like aldo/keto reductase
VPVLSNPAVQAIAKAHGKSPAQVALRWVLQRNATFVTAGANVDYLREDLEVFDFALTGEDMAQLDAV